MQQIDRRNWKFYSIPGLYSKIIVVLLSDFQFSSYYTYWIMLESRLIRRRIRADFLEVSLHPRNALPVSLVKGRREKKKKGNLINSLTTAHKIMKWLLKLQRTSDTFEPASSWYTGLIWVSWPSSSFSPDASSRNPLSPLLSFIRLVFRPLLLLIVSGDQNVSWPEDSCSCVDDSGGPPLCTGPDRTDTFGLGSIALFLDFWRCRRM